MPDESNPAPEAATPPPENTDPPGTEPAKGEAELGDAGKQALDRMKAERNDAAKRAKDFERELKALRASSMTETEKAIAEAETRGRTAATTEYGKRLARTEFDAIAARRNPDADTAKALRWVDMATLLDENGEPDAKAIQSAVNDTIPPATAKGPVSFDGGARTTAAPAASMNERLRAQLGRT